MFRFVLLLVCLLPSQAFPATIDSGLYGCNAPRNQSGGFEISEPTLITGGEFRCYIYPSAPLEITGGTFVPVGSHKWFQINRDFNPDVTIRMLWARYETSTIDSDAPKGNDHVEGWLLDGTFARFSLNREDGVPGHTRIIVEPDPTIELPLWADADGDQDMDINDLNIVRNNFGSAGAGDFYEDGSVGIEDLNYIRNTFGRHQWTTEFSAAAGETILPFGSHPVPEPSSIVLVLLGITALYSKFR